MSNFRPLVSLIWGVQHISIIFNKTSFLFCLLYTTKFCVSYLFEFIWQLALVESFVSCRCKSEIRHLGAFWFSLLVHKVREFLTTACSYGGLEIKSAYFLKYMFYSEITLKLRVLSWCAFHFFIFRISGKYQTMSFWLTVVLFPELEKMK